MRKIAIASSIMFVVFFQSCKTVDFEKNITSMSDYVTTTEKIAAEEKTNGQVDQVIYVEQPAIVKTEPSPETKKVTGYDAVQQNLETVTILPESHDGKLKAFVYSSDSVYQIICQTYHSTVIKLEPGEQIVDMPYISEPEVWKVAVGGDTNQFLLVKPDYTDLISTLIINTNRRLYQLELRSTKTSYMPTVKWVYPQNYIELSRFQTNSEKKGEATLSNFNPDLLSMDYVMKKPFFKKYPVWTPVATYDYKNKTYIVLDKKSLIMEYPVIFNEKNKIINYEVKDNVIVLNQLIEKVTLQLGKEKISITKKKSKAPTAIQKEEVMNVTE